MVGGIWELFGRKQDGTPAPAVGTQQMQTTQASSAHVASNPTLPGTEARSDGSGPAAFPAAGTGEQSPLDKYKDLWVVSDKDKVVGNPVPKLTADPKKLAEVFSEVDVMKNVDPALLQKATGGDMAAMTGVISSAVQAALVHAAQVSSGITENALTSLNSKYEKEIIPEVLRRHAASTQIRQDNKIFEDPRVAPMLAGMESQFLKKYPDAPPAEISKMAKEYLGEFAKMIVGGNGTEAGAAGGTSQGSSKVNDFNWADWVTKS